MSRSLLVEDLVCRFGGDQPEPITAVDGVGFEVSEGEVFTLLGPSGCGKTTILRAVAGLEHPVAGRVWIGGVLASGGPRRPVPPHRRDIGMVFQSYGIWPHLTVFENAAFPLRVRRPRPTRPQLHRRVAEALAAVQLTGYEDRPATQLSGGQQQRLALARALARRPRLLLLDEPLSNLDAKLREAMRAELASLQRRLAITTVYVTHDQSEALGMSDRIAVLQAGRIVQQGRPADLYRSPRNRFVADFLGTTNLLDGTVCAGANGQVWLDTGLGRLVIAQPGPQRPGSRVLLAVRAEAARLHLVEPPDGTGNVVCGEVHQRMFLGDRVDCRVRVGERILIARHDPDLPTATGDRVWLELPAATLTILPYQQEQP